MVTVAETRWPGATTTVFGHPHADAVVARLPVRPCTSSTPGASCAGACAADRAAWSGGGAQIASRIRAGARPTRTGRSARRRWPGASAAISNVAAVAVMRVLRWTVGLRTCRASSIQPGQRGGCQPDHAVAARSVDVEDVAAVAQHLLDHMRRRPRRRPQAQQPDAFATPQAVRCRAASGCSARRVVGRGRRGAEQHGVRRAGEASNHPRERAPPCSPAAHRAYRPRDELVPRRGCRKKRRRRAPAPPRRRNGPPAAPWVSRSGGPASRTIERFGDARPPPRASAGGSAVRHGRAHRS